MNGTVIGAAKKYMEVASVFICVHEDDITAPEKPKVYRIDVEQAKFKPYVIGRMGSGGNSAPDIILDSPHKNISRNQGRIGYANDRWVFLPDMPSNGVIKNYILRNGRWENISSNIELTSMSVIGFGWKNHNGKEFPVATMVFVPYKVGLNQTKVAINRPVINIGRVKNENDIVISKSYVSRKHAQIICKNTDMYIKDLDSLNGIWDSNGRIRKRNLCDVDAFSISDVLFVKIGPYLFFNNPNVAQPAQPQKEAEVLVQVNVNEKRVGNKVLIKDITNLNIRKGELVAVIGGSGAGKTTLMNCINGLDTSYSGKVLFDGVDIKAKGNFDKLKYLVGLVPQANVIHPYLTVRQELSQAAKLRGMGDATQEEVRQMVQKVVSNDLHLEDCIDKKISVLSGGQARRVSIGIELVAKRMMLCLDEPDAGLDPLTKRNLFNDLKKLTNSGVTIIIIIHDVSYMDVFDKVIVMGKYTDRIENDSVGGVAYCGSPNDALSYFNAKDFIEVYEKLITQPYKYFKGAKQ